MKRARVGVAFFFTAVAIASIAPPASAHALIRRSDPADGALLNQAPSRVVIDFTEPPDPKLSSIQVIDSSGASVTSGPSEVVSGRPLEMTVPLRDIGRGVYSVTWRTVSKSDGHTTGGSFSFGVGVKPGTAPPRATVSSASPSVLSVVGRTSFYLGLFVLLAGAVLAFSAMAGRPPAARVVLPLASAAAIAGIAMMFIAEHAVTGASWADLFSSTAGRDIWQQGVAVVVASIAAIGVIGRPGKASLTSLAVASAAALFLHADASHAGGSAHLAWFQIGIQWLHMTAVAVWIGGLIWLLVAVAALERDRRVAAVKRFSFTFGITLGVIFVTGMVRLIQELGSWGAWAHLLATGFGTAAVIKLALFLVLVGLAAINRYRNVPRLADGHVRMRPLARVVACEVAIGVAVLGVTAVLSQLPPPNDISQQSRVAAAQQLVVSGHDFGTTTKVRLAVSPGTVGPNRFTATVTDFDTGAAVHATDVSLQFSVPGQPDVASTLQLRNESGASWVGRSTVLALDATWDVDVVVQTASGGVDIPLKLTPRRPPEKIQVAKQAGQPTIYTIDIGGGSTVQAYVDPGTPGTNNVHWTFFNAAGNELPVAKASSTATQPDGETSAEKLLRFSKGHFVANATLVAGKWTFQIDAMTKEGASVSAYFTQDIEP